MAGWSVPGVVPLRQVREDPVGRRVVARHRMTRKPLAITYLSPELLADAEFRTRFGRECAQLARVRQAPSRQTGVARVYRYVDCDHGAAVIGEHINGTTLRSLLLAQGAIGTEAALVVLKDLLAALAPCHQAGLAHGDVKPDDVVLTCAGRVRLLDFGLWTTDGRQRLSRSTPFYLAPEQWTAPAVSRPSGDVYAATVTFFECLVGAPPFFADDAAQLSAKHQGSLVPLEVLPEAVRELVLRGLAKNSTSRPDAQNLLAAVGDVAARAIGSDWERRGRQELAGHLGGRSTLADISSLSRRIDRGRLSRQIDRGRLSRRIDHGQVSYRRNIRLAAVMGGALALAAGLSSPPLAVIPGINIFGSGGRPPVLAFPEPDRGAVAMRVATNGRPADRASMPSARAGTAGPVAGVRPPASSIPEANPQAVPYDQARHDALPQRAARPDGATSESTPDQSTRACAGQLGDGTHPCTAGDPKQVPGSAGSRSDPSEVSVPVALPAPLPPIDLPLKLPLPLPAPVQDLKSLPIPDKTGLDKTGPDKDMGPGTDFQHAKRFPSQVDSQVPRKMTVRSNRSDVGRHSFGQPRTFSQKGFGDSRGGDSRGGDFRGAGRMGTR